jgi:hypothetical protein
MHAARDRWAGLVRRWRRSGQSAREFVERAGLNAGTLAYWAWRLNRERAAAPAPKRVRGARATAKDVDEQRGSGGFLLDRVMA